MHGSVPVSPSRCDEAAGLAALHDAIGRLAFVRDAAEASVRRLALLEERCWAQTEENAALKRSLQGTISDTIARVAEEDGASPTAYASDAGRSSGTAPWSKRLLRSKVLLEREARAVRSVRRELHVAVAERATRSQAVAQRERLSQIETHTLECMAKRAAIQGEIETAEQTKKVVAEETDDLLSMNDQLGQATAETARLGASLEQATAALSSANKAAARKLEEKNAVCLSQHARITELAELTHSKQRRVTELELGMQDAAIKLAASERRVRDADRAAAAGGTDGIGRVLAEGRADTGDLVILYRRRGDGMWAVANSPSGTTLDADTFWGDSLSTITTDDRVVVLAKVVMRNANGSILVEMFAPAINVS